MDVDVAVRQVEISPFVAGAIVIGMIAVGLIVRWRLRGGTP